MSIDETIVATHSKDSSWHASLALMAICALDGVTRDNACRYSQRVLVHTTCMCPKPSQARHMMTLLSKQAGTVFSSIDLLIQALSSGLATKRWMWLRLGARIR